MRRLTVVVAVVLGCGSAFGQQGITPATAPAFEVVTIKLNNSGSGSSRLSADATRLLVTNLSLQELLEYAYNIKQDLISGVTGPVASAKFDVVAKVGAPEEQAWNRMDRKQRGAMLQAVLADRFGAKAHVETKELPLYELVVKKGGPKFKAVGVTEHTGHISSGRTRVIGTGISMGAFTGVLADTVHRTVVDKTGLNGNYDIDLQWAPEGMEQSEGLPGIFTAVEDELGLRLRAAKGPVEVLVVESAKMPSED